MPLHCTPDEVGPQVSRFGLGAGSSILVDHIGDGQVFWLWWCSTPSGLYFHVGHNLSTCVGDSSIRLFAPWNSVEDPKEVEEAMNAIAYSGTFRLSLLEV